MYESDFFKKCQEEFPRVYPIYPCAGFYVPVGWEEMIRNLSKELQEYLEAHPEVEFQCDQVKPKFFSLRFYVTTQDNNIWKVIDRYEEESLKICEVCGHDTKTFKNGHMLCGKCPE
jgi:hypothetical protein